MPQVQDSHGSQVDQHREKETVLAMRQMLEILVARRRGNGREAHVRNSLACPLNIAIIVMDREI